MKFKKIISKDEFNSYSKDKKEMYYIDNQIYVYDDTDAVIEHFGVKAYRIGGSFNAFYKINNDLKKEIICDFLTVMNQSSNVEHLIADIRNKLSLALNKEHFNKILYKEHEVYFDLINKLDMSHAFLKSLQDDMSHFEEIVMNHLSEESIIKHITTGINFNKTDIFTNWGNLMNYTAVLDFIKKKLNKNNSSINEDIQIDVDVEELSTKVQKIMMMKELGIIDLLIEKYIINKYGVVNVNVLANIIHTFTGLGKETIRPALNPIFNDSGKDPHKNSPYTNKKNLATIKAKMIELGLIE